MPKDLSGFAQLSGSFVQLTASPDKLTSNAKVIIRFLGNKVIQGQHIIVIPNPIWSDTLSLLPQKAIFQYGCFAERSLTVC